MLFAKINKLSTTPFASVPVPPSRSVGISNVMVSVSPADNTSSPLSASSHTADDITGIGKETKEMADPISIRDGVSCCIVEGA